MNRKINRIILVLTFLLCLNFVNAFEINVTAPIDGAGPFGDVLPLINVSSTLGANMNCTYSVDDSSNPVVGGSINGTQDIWWNNVDISSLDDGSLTLLASCMEDVNASNLNTSSITISKDSSPDVTWGNPIENDNLSSDDDSFILIVQVNSSNYVINESDLSVFTVSCDNGDNGTLVGNPIYNLTLGFNGDVYQNWTTPVDSANCSITVNVSNNMSYYNSAVVNVDVINDDRLDDIEVEFGDYDTFSMIGNVNSYLLTGLFLSINSSDGFYFNLTHYNICSAIPEPYEFPLGVSFYNSSEGLWEADPSGFNCSVNISELSPGSNNLTFDIFLNDSSLTSQKNYTIYYDPTLPEIHFEWWNTTAWNVTDNTTYDLVLPDYEDLISNLDIFFAPNDIINISINITDDAVFNSTIDRAFANFTGFDLGQTTSCVGLVALIYNGGNGLWEGNCSLGDFSSQLDALPDDVVTGNITFIVYDAYNNTNTFSYYNLSDSSAVCVSQSPDCMPLHVPSNLHDFGQLESYDDCFQFNGDTTNLSAEEDFSDINLVLDVHINLSCDYEDSSLPSTFEPLMKFNFSSVDFSNPSASSKLLRLVDAIDFDFNGVGSFGDSYIYINSTAFEELDTNATIEMYHIPFIEEPSIVAETLSHFNSTSVIWVSNGADSFYNGSPITGNLTFEVFGFSGYEITDNSTPIVTINAPVDEFNTSNSLILVNATINGTGTLVSSAKFLLGITEIKSYSYGGSNSANCTEVGSGSDTINCIFNYNITTGDNTYILSVYGQDFGGDNGNNLTTNISINLDTVEPNATQVSNPTVTSAGWSGDDFYNFTFRLYDDVSTTLDYDFWVTNSTGADVQATITGSAIAGELEGIYANLTDGIDGETLTWHFFILDQAGNTATYSDNFSIDRVDPSSSISGNHSDWEYANYNVTLTAQDAASGVASIKYEIGNGGIVTVNANTTTFELNTSGEYNVTFWSLDVAGNTESNNTFIVKLDQSAPTTTDDAPSGWQTSDFTVTLSPSDIGTGVNYTNYSINGAANVTGTSISITTEGVYNVTYYSVDNASQKEDENIFLVQLDKTAPSTAVTGNQSGSTYIDYNVTLTVTDALSGISYINYSVDGGSVVQVMNSTAIILISTEGSYNVSFYAVDNAGNIEASENFSVSHDSSPPVTTVSGNSTAWQNANFTITFSATDGLAGVNYTEYNINSSGWVTLVGTDLNITTDGSYNVSYRSIDNATNLETANSFVVKLDKVAPTGLSDDAPSTLQTSSFNVTLSATDVLSGINYYNSSINGAANVSGNIVEFTTEGSYNVTYYAVDNAGNMGSLGTFNVTVDNTAPVTTDNAPSGWQTSDFTITLSPTDGLTGVNNTYYSINGSTAVAGTSIAISTEGEYNVSYYSTDNANNSETANVVLVQLDKTAPLLNITSPLNTTYTSSTIILTTSSTDTNSGVNSSSCLSSIDGAGYVTCPSSLTSLDDGSHILLVNISDDAGNIQNSNVTFVVQEVPNYSVVKVKLPLEYNETNNYWFNITLTDNTAVSFARLNLNGTWQNMSDEGSGLWSYNQTNLSSGSYNYYYWANDSSNNIWTSDNSTFVVRALEATEKVINESDFEVPVNVTNVIVDTLENVTIPVNATNTVTIDLSNSVSNGEVTLVEPVVMQRSTATVNYTVAIPAGTKLNASSSWDGKMIMPEVETGVEVPSGQEGTVDLAIKMGSDDYEIAFDKAVKIVLPNQANKSAAWKRGSGDLTIINTTCDSTTNPTNINAVSPRICSVTSGSDLFVFTYHFTTFAAGNWTTPTSSGGGGGSSKDIYRLGELYKGEAVGQTLRKNDIIKFTQRLISHKLTLNDVDYDNKMITVTIESEPIVIDMIESNIYEIDIDENGLYDTNVWFEFNSKSRPIVYLMEIEEVFDKEDIEDVLNSSVMPVKEISDKEIPDVNPENVDNMVIEDNVDIVSEDNIYIPEIYNEDEEYNYSTLGIVLGIILAFTFIVGYFLFFKK